MTLDVIKVLMISTVVCFCFPRESTAHVLTGVMVLEWRDFSVGSSTDTTFVKCVPILVL